LRNKPSAIGLRQVLPVQTKSTCLWADIAAQPSHRSPPVKPTFLPLNPNMDLPHQSSMRPHQSSELAGCWEIKGLHPIVDAAASMIGGRIFWV
jgi:hypothetical protein